MTVLGAAVALAGCVHICFYFVIVVFAQALFAPTGGSRDILAGYLWWGAGIAVAGLALSALASRLTSRPGLALSALAIAAGLGVAAAGLWGPPIIGLPIVALGAFFALFALLLFVMRTLL